MRVHRLRIARHRLLVRLLGPGDVALLEIQGSEPDVKRRAFVERGLHLLEPGKRRVDVRGPRRGVYEKHEGVEVLRVLLEDRRRVRTRVVGAPRHEIDGRQLEADVLVLGLQLSRLVQERKRVVQLAGLIVRQAEIADCNRVAGLDAQHVAVLDDGILIVLPRQEFVAALEMTRLFSLGRARTAGADSDAEAGDEDHGAESLQTQHRLHPPHAQSGRYSESTGWSACRNAVRCAAVAGTLP